MTVPPGSMVSPAGRNAATATGAADPEDPVGQRMMSLYEAELALAALPPDDEATIRDLPTAIGRPTDPNTDAAVSSLRASHAILSVARTMVGVTSTAPGGSWTVRCTGIVLGVCSDEAGKRARILTSSTTVCTSKGTLRDPKPKLSVCLPNETVLDGQLLFFSDHYGLALLEIMVDFELELASFGASPQYGQEVYVLARGGSLMVRRGTILFSQEPFLGRSHNMFLSCEIPECGTGGPVIDHDGMVTGMVFCHSPIPAIIATSTVLKCTEMWIKYSLIARPVLGMHLRNVKAVKISLLDKLYCCYGIKEGFIVDQVTIDSTAETLGIRQGDVIVFNGLWASTLPQLEDFLLSRGQAYLEKNIDSCPMVDFELEVHDLLGRTRTSTILTVGLTDASEQGDEDASQDRLLKKMKQLQIT